MTVAEYRAAGFSVSLQTEQAAIDRAEKDTITAYITPLCGVVPSSEELATEPLKTALMSISMLLLLQRNVAATRVGAKAKNTPQSDTPTSDDVLKQNARACVLALCKIDATKNPAQVCSDICGLFYTSTFFHN